jgi:aminoglycoside phosphotransferase family enzyme/predicted kinase
MTQVPADVRVETAKQEPLVKAMLDPQFYPKPPDMVSHKETHISHLFFVGELVFKLKKPMRYSFLDYSTLEKRRGYYQEELRLNRRLAPSVYIGVMPITFDDLGWRLGGWAEPMEYVLVMRRLPEKRMLSFLLDTGQVTAAMMRELAELLAHFHRGAERVGHVDPRQYPGLVRRQWSENIADLKPLLSNAIDEAELQAVDGFAHEFIDSHEELFAQRAEQGWLRDVHGDLHTEHVCFAPEGIQIFDCVEFEPKFRRCDLASEMAFLAMDIEARGKSDLVEPFLLRYGERIQDKEFLKLLPFWKCYRAMVRAKVYALRGGDGFAIAQRYLRYAVKLAWQQWQPFLILISGFTGSGKSTLAKALSERLGAAHINSDVVRKALAGKTGRQPEAYGEGIYSLPMTEKTYEKMAREAKKLIASGKGVILDATFSRRAHRQRMAHLAAKHRIPFVLIHCSAGEDLIYRRLLQRAAHDQDVSDGRWGIYLQQKDSFEAVDEVDPGAYLELSSDGEIDKLAAACETFVRGNISPNK